MKTVFLAVLFLVSNLAHADNEEVVCWNQRSSSRRPIFKARIVNSNILSNLSLGEYKEFEGPIEGKINARAIKYKGFYFFEYRSDDSFVEVILPNNFSETSEYFGGAIRTTMGDGGGTIFIKCRIYQ